MSTTKPPVPSEVPTLTTLMPLLTALGTAIAAWKLFEPKLGRIRALREESGRLSRGFWTFYCFPQYALIALSGLATVFLLLAFLDAFAPLAFDWVPGLEWIKSVVSLPNLVWVLLFGVIAGAVIYWNLLSRLFLFLGHAVSLLPIPGLSGLFGPRGRSAGWNQTASVCEGPDKGAPLMIDPQAVEVVANILLGKVVNRANNLPNFAAEPAALSIDEKANVALLGCVMEANFYRNRWPNPGWAAFYESVAEIQTSTQIFTPANLAAFPSGAAFFEVFRDQLEAVLSAHGEPAPPDRSLAAGDDVIKTWEILKKKGGSVLSLIPGYAPWLGGKMFWLDLRARAFPQLDSDGMRPQFLKLLVRWGVLGRVPGIFTQPFAKRQAWLLLQHRAVRALPELKEVTFNATGQVGISRIAAHRVIKRVSEMIAESAVQEVVDLRQRLAQTEWSREQTADVVFWDWATEAAKEAGAEKWDKAKWLWRYEGDRVLRQA